MTTFTYAPLAVIATALTLAVSPAAIPKAARHAAQTTAPSDPRRELTAILPALAPHASLGGQAAVFDRFVGAWDSEYITYGADGATTRRRAEVIFGWIIDGRALQDVWITYPADGSADERDIGTSIRFWNPQLAAWRVLWVHPSSGVVLSLTGGAVGDRIVLDGRLGDGSRLRWSFNDIRPDSFIWRGESSSDDGRTWRPRNEHRMKRRGRSAVR